MQAPETPARKKSNLRNTLLWSFSILLTLLLVFDFARNADWGEVGKELSEANYFCIFLGISGEVGFLFFRALRWKVILAPLQKQISYWSLLKAQVISFAISGVAPGKLGEVARPVFLSRWEGIPLTTSAASTVLERGLDLIAIIFIWFMFLVFSTKEISPASKPYMDVLNTISIAIFAFGTAFIFLLLWFARKRKDFKKMAEGSSYLERSPLLGKLVHHFFVFAEGLQSFQKKRMIALLLLLSLITWGSVAVTCYYAPKAVGLNLPASSALLILTVSIIGASLPTPGGVGGVHKSIEIAVEVFYGFSKEFAKSAALVGHAMMFLPSIIWGGLYLVLGKIKLGEVSFSPEKTGSTDDQGG